jgi:hypothetical protein
MDKVQGFTAPDFKPMYKSKVAWLVLTDMRGDTHINGVEVRVWKLFLTFSVNLFLTRVPRQFNGGK